MSSVISRDTATPLINKIWDVVAPGRRKALMAVLGREGEHQYRAWFRLRENDSPNKQGWPRQHFWSRIRTATAYDPSRTTDDRAVITVSDPALSAKVHGGTWGAKEAKNLAIPLRAEVYGKRPKSGVIAGLQFIPSRGGGNVVGWLASKNGNETVYWWRLQRTVTVPVDPRALPPRGDVLAALGNRAKSFLFR